MIRFSGFEDLPTSLINTIVNTALRVSFSININYRFIIIYVQPISPRYESFCLS